MPAARCARESHERTIFLELPRFELGLRNVMGGQMHEPEAEHRRSD